eukprot:1162073-Pelagomonas_calceolata.AAC.3
MKLMMSVGLSAMLLDARTLLLPSSTAMHQNVPVSIEGNTSARRAVVDTGLQRRSGFLGCVVDTFFQTGQKNSGDQKGRWRHWTSSRGCNFCNCCQFGMLLI